MAVAILGEGKADLHKHLLLSNLSFDIAFLLFLNLFVLLGIKKLRFFIGEKIDWTKTDIYSYVKDQEDFREEFKIMRQEVGKIKEVLKNKLGVEIDPKV
jgi:hypothetical protein